MRRRSASVLIDDGTGAYRASGRGGRVRVTRWRWHHRAVERARWQAFKLSLKAQYLLAVAIEAPAELRRRLRSWPASR